MQLPLMREDLAIPVLCSAATACRRLQHLAMMGVDWGSGSDMGAAVRGDLHQ